MIYDSNTTKWQYLSKIDNHNDNHNNMIAKIKHFITSKQEAAENQLLNDRDTTPNIDQLQFASFKESLSGKNIKILSRNGCIYK